MLLLLLLPLNESERWGTGLAGIRVWGSFLAGRPASLKYTLHTLTAATQTVIVMIFSLAWNLLLSIIIWFSLTSASSKLSQKWEMFLQHHLQIET